MVTATPRRAFRRFGEAPRISSPRYLTLPLTLPLAARRPKAARKSWLLPEPDSPTTPRHSLSRMARLAFFTASTVPSAVSKRTFRLVISSSGVIGLLGPRRHAAHRQ